ncbi:MAG: hypothetical protein J6B39_04790, partial [Lachnospiraceae bacterium]|nr:hypothetical protein [Lachnospiraceae bacterium]
MVKRKLIKKIALLGTTIAMMAGTMLTAFAATVTDEFDICGDGYAACKLTCNANSAVATTHVYASYCIACINIYMELELEAYNSDGSCEYYISDNRHKDFEKENIIIGVGTQEETWLPLELSEPLEYNLGVYANSYHSAQIDGGGSECRLWT